MEIINLLDGYSLEVILFSILTFVLTELIKLPIKKATSKFEENKRKTINIVILFIPLVLSFLESFLYYGITTKVWFSVLMLASGLSIFLLSLSIYAIASRLFIVIKCILQGKQLNGELTSEMVAYIKENIKALLSKVKLGEKEVDSLLKSLESLTQLKKLLSEDKVDPDLSKLAEVEENIQSTSRELSEKTKEVEANREKLEKYKAELYKS